MFLVNSTCFFIDITNQRKFKREISETVTSEVHIENGGVNFCLVVSEN